MKRLGFSVLLLFIVAAAPVFADVSITMSMSMNVGPMAINTSMLTRVKGMKVRTDTKMMQQDASFLLDVAAKQMWMVNHASKEITNADPQAMTAGMPVNFGEATVSVKPNGQTKELLGRTCKGFALDVSLPMTMAEEAVMMRMTGTIWVAADGPGVAEFVAASKAAAAVGLSASPIGQGPQARGFIEMQNAIADAGIPFAQEISIVMDGTGQMAAMMAQMGSMTMSMTVTEVTTGAIADDVFVLPAGYTKK